MKAERLFVSFLILLAAGSMSFFSPSTIYQPFPLIFGVVAFTGYAIKKIFVLDTGVFLTVVSYLFANGGLSLTINNLIVIMVFFFLSIGIWFYARNTLLMSGIRGRCDDESDIGLSKFRRGSINEILNTLLMGFLLSILASVIFLYSSLDMAMGSLVNVLLTVLFSAGALFVTFLIIKLLFSEKIEVGDES